MSQILTDSREEAVLEHYDHDKYDEYWCINIKPFKCPGCNRAICYAVTGPHLILIWEEKDDETILDLANVLMKDGNYDPRIVQYNRILGPCIEYEKAEQLGWLNDPIE